MLSWCRYVLSVSNWGQVARSATRSNTLVIEVDIEKCRKVVVVWNDFGCTDSFKLNNRLQI